MHGIINTRLRVAFVISYQEGTTTTLAVSFLRSDVCRILCFVIELLWALVTGSSKVSCVTNPLSSWSPLSISIPYSLYPWRGVTRVVRSRVLATSAIRLPLSSDVMMRGLECGIFPDRRICFADCGYYIPVPSSENDRAPFTVTNRELAIAG